MGITGLIPFIEKASRRANVNEFDGCTVAIDSYCWLHKGAFACADKLVRGEDTDIHIKYCMKYVAMLLSKNIKPILVFDGRHLPAKAMTEAKRRESRDISKRRAAELLTLGKTEEARSYMRRSVDITHAMALSLIKECRSRNVDCVVAPYEADAQLAYLNIKNIAQLVITEDSDLVLFGCTKVLFKMDLDGQGTLVETIKLPLVMKCPIEKYTFDKFRQMCIMSGCDYLASLPGIGLAKARQFVTTTQDDNFANALKKLPGFFNKSTLKVTDEYRENFLKAEATFKHQYVYDPIERKMVRLNDPDDEDIEEALCVNAGKLLDDTVAFELALGNLDPFTLKKMDDWHPDKRPVETIRVKTGNWKDKSVSQHPSIWSSDFKVYLNEHCPWQRRVKKSEPVTAITQKGPKKKVVVNLVSKYVPETQDESLSIETLSSMYSVMPVSKKSKTNSDNANLANPLSQYSQGEHDIAFVKDEVNEASNERDKSPILENKRRSYKKAMSNISYSVMKRFSRFPRTVLHDEDDVIESKFFRKASDMDSGVSSSNQSQNSVIIEESPEKNHCNPFKIKSPGMLNQPTDKVSPCLESPESLLESPEMENSIKDTESKRSLSPILVPSPARRKLFDQDHPTFDVNTEDSVIENTYPLQHLVTAVDSQSSIVESPLKENSQWYRSQPQLSQKSSFNTISNRTSKFGIKKSNCKVPGLKRISSLPSNQPTLLNKFGFQKKPVLKKC